MSIFDKDVICPNCECKFPCRTNYIDKRFEEQSTHQYNVEKFMKLGEQEIPSSPCIPSLETRRLRAKLIMEEALETIKALGLEADFLSDELEPCSGDHITQNDEGFEVVFHETGKATLKDIVDGCCDLRVVTTGTLSACGVKDLQPQELVDANNLNKFKWKFSELPEEYKGRTLKHVGDYIEVAVVREDGKIIKPPSHKPPSLDKEIFRQEQRYAVNQQKPLL